VLFLHSRVQHIAEQEAADLYADGHQEDHQAAAENFTVKFHLKGFYDAARQGDIHHQVRQKLPVAVRDHSDLAQIQPQEHKGK
jgi:hypothetical protein